MSPRHPDRVAFETPRGHIHTGDVVDTVLEAHRDLLFVVDLDGHRFRIPESEAVVV